MNLISTLKRRIAKKYNRSIPNKVSIAYEMLQKIFHKTITLQNTKHVQFMPDNTNSRRDN